MHYFITSRMDYETLVQEKICLQWKLEKSDKEALLIKFRTFWKPKNQPTYPHKVIYLSRNQDKKCIISLLVVWTTRHWCRKKICLQWKLEKSDKEAPSIKFRQCLNKSSGCPFLVLLNTNTNQLP
jgi:hypothetical protein